MITTLKRIINLIKKVQIKILSTIVKFKKIIFLKIIKKFN